MINHATAVAPPSTDKASSRSPGPVSRPAPSRVHAAPVVDAVPLHGGSTLPPTLQQRMEASFGESFDNVRVHTDAPAERLASSQRAEAVTMGPRIAFGAGRFRPGSANGDHLIAHELAHVAQQRGRRRGAPGPFSGVAASRTRRACGRYRRRPGGAGRARRLTWPGLFDSQPLDAARPERLSRTSESRAAPRFGWPLSSVLRAACRCPAGSPGGLARGRGGSALV